MFWDFISLRPESTHQTMILFSDRGLPDGYRFMNGYGSHTFKLVNADGEAFWCKFHYKVNYFYSLIIIQDPLDGNYPSSEIKESYFPYETV